MYVSVLPPNALLLIMDPFSGEVPESMGGKLVASTQSCIAIGTRPPSDGETQVKLQSDGPGLSKLVKAHEGIIEISGEKIAICTVYGDVILEEVVGSSKAKVAIWVDDVFEPKTIEVHFGAA